MALSPIAVQSYRQTHGKGLEVKGSGRRCTPPEVWKNRPSIQWLIERAPTEEILIELLEHAAKLPANQKTRRRWADAAEERARWLAINPPRFEPVSVAEFLAEPVLVGEPVEAEGFEAQRKGIPFDQCPYDEAVEDTDDIDAPAAWRRGWLRADQTPKPVVDDRPKVADVKEFIVDEVNAQREWFCAANGIFQFEGPDGKPVSIHEYFGIQKAE